MRMIICLPILLAALVSGESFAAKSPIISNMTVGLLHSREERGFYKQGSSFPYEENGLCPKGNENVPCMWWGWSFDYQGVKVGSVISCRIRNSFEAEFHEENGEKETDPNYLDALVYQDVISESGRFFFSVAFKADSDDWNKDEKARTTNVTCTYQLEDNVSFDFKILSPPGHNHSLKADVPNGPRPELKR